MRGRGHVGIYITVARGKEFSENLAMFPNLREKEGLKVPLLNCLKGQCGLPRWRSG